MKYSIIFFVDKPNDEFGNFFHTICEFAEQKIEDFEILIVANRTEAFITSTMTNDIMQREPIKIIAFPGFVSQAVSLKAAVDESSGDIILAFGSDQELTEESYDKLLIKLEDDVDVVVPNRKLRKDPVIYRLHSKIFNQVIIRLIGVELNDIGCKVRYFRREVFDNIDLCEHVFKFLPMLARQKGFKIKEIECEQIEKDRIHKIYRIRKYLDSIVEIVNLFFSTKYSKKPLRFFNLIGFTLIILGGMSLIVIGINKVFFDQTIGNSPLLLIGMISLVAGTQASSFGLLGEIISFMNGRQHKEYNIEKII
jgi:hypothetical protein